MSTISIPATAVYSLNGEQTLWRSYSIVYDLMGDVPFVKDLRKRHVASMGGLEHVLDGGCGPGLIAQSLAESGAKAVVGIDVNNEMLKVAADRLKYLKDVALYRADVHQLPFADSTFDGAVSNMVLYFVDDPHKVLLEMARITRPGGLLSIASLRPHFDIEVLLEATYLHLQSLGLERSLIKEFEVFAASNRALSERARNLYEPDEIAEMMLKYYNCQTILDFDTTYLGQGFFVLAKRRDVS